MATPKKSPPRTAARKPARTKKAAATAPTVDVDEFTSQLTKELLGKVLQKAGANVQEDEASGSFMFTGELSLELILAGFMAIGQSAGMLAVIIQDGMPKIDMDVLISNLEDAFESGMEAFEDVAVPVTTH